MTRDEFARLVYAVLGLIDGISGNGADGVVANVPTLAPSFFDEGCPLGVDAITKKKRCRGGKWFDAKCRAVSLSACRAW